MPLVFRGLIFLYPPTRCKLPLPLSLFFLRSLLSSSGPPGGSHNRLAVSAALKTSPLHSDGRIKQERVSRETNTIMAKHERAEFIRKQRDREGAVSPGLSSAGAENPQKPVAPTKVFGGPVRGLNFSHVCNMRAITPGSTLMHCSWHPHHSIPVDSS